MEQVVALLKHDDADVRWVAFDALDAMASDGDERAIAALGDCLEVEDLRLQANAAGALARISAGSYEVVLGAVTQRIAHEDPDVRLAAVETLAAIDTMGDSSVLECVAFCLDDEDKDIRNAAVRAMDRASGQGVALVMARIQDTLRQQAQAALEKMGSQFDANGHTLQAGDGGSWALTDSDRGASSSQGSDTDRVAAAAYVETLGTVSRPGSARALDALYRHVCHANPEVRKQAAAAMAKVALPFDETAIATLRELLDDEDAGVRWAALEALGDMKALQ